MAVKRVCDADRLDLIKSVKDLKKTKPKDLTNADVKRLVVVMARMLGILKRKND